MRKFLNNPKFAIALALLALTAVARAVIAGLPDRDDPLGPAVLNPLPAAPPPPAAAEPALNRPGLAQALAASTPAMPDDPFAREARVPAGPRVTLHLSALWREGSDVLAVVNGRIVRPGESIGGVKVAAAVPEGLAFESGGIREIVAVGGEWTAP